MLNNSNNRENQYIDDSSTEDNDSFSDDSFDSFNNNLGYNSEISSKYKLLIPVIFNKDIHGFNSQSDPNINGQILVQDCIRIKTNDSIGKLFCILKKRCKFYNRCYKGFYNNISPNYLKPEIGEIHYLRGDECVCILKTFWLKIIQRTWKKFYKLRQQIFKLRCRPDAILYKQITGKFPDHCNNMPSIRGMLSPHQFV
jgi:hypothetical protein